MTREKFIEELNFNCKVDGKEVWLNIMPCLEKLLDEHEVQLKAKDEEIERLKKLVNYFNNTYSVGDFDFESYYAMLKDN